MEEKIIFTKGSYIYETKHGSYGAIIINSDGSRDFISGESDDENITSTRMQLISVIRSLEKAEEKSEGRMMIDLYSNNKIVVNGINDWLDDWKRKDKTMKHMDLWDEIFKFKARHDIMTFLSNKTTYYMEFAKYLSQEGRKKQIKIRSN